MGHDVTILDNITTGQLSNTPIKAKLINIDLADKESLNMIPVEDYKAILHLAAQTSGEISNENPHMDLTTNAIGTLNLLQWCSANNIKRFLYASSMAVYGLTGDEAIHESHPLNPYSFYGISKQTAENYVHHFDETGISTTILRMFNVYGPGQDLSNMKQGMVSIYLSYLCQNIPILVKGSLDRFRDYIFIEDVTEAWIRCIDNPDTYGKTYNLASGNKILVKDLLSSLISAWGYDPKDYKIQLGENTPRDQFGIYADTTSLTKTLQWHPEYSLDQGLQIMCKWAKTLSN